MKYSLKKGILFLASIFLCILLFIGFQTFRFHRLTNTLFREEMSGDTLSMHYVLANPENYGIPGDCPSLPIYSREAQKQGYLQLKLYKKTASQIHSVFFGKDNRLLHTLLMDYLESRSKEEDFPYYAEPLSPASGVQSSLPILLAEYTFRSQQDVENYLSLLEQIPAYLEGIAQYEKEKAQAGLFMSDIAADKVIDQCYQIIDFNSLTNDTHFLNTSFSERLLPLVEKNLITPEQRTAYIQQNHILLLETVLPAYEALGDEILVLKGSGREERGLSRLPKGKEYYTFLFSQSTGSDRSVAEVQNLLAMQLKKDTKELAALLEKSPDLSAASLEESFPQAEPAFCLQDLRQRMAEDFPPMPGDTEPSCTVKRVSPSLEEYSSPAFYLTPPIDDITENSIYINEKDPMTGLDLYTTLAHEGYPGHLYQTVYFQLCQQNKNSNPARSLLHYGGYCEGWALYVEMQSYQYAKELLKESGASQDLLSLVEAIRLNRSIQLCLYSLLDLEIHYNGSSVEEVSDFLSGFGVTDFEIAQNIYEYIAQEPANYPKYYVSYLEFEILKEEAKEKWGESYSDIRFHQKILETGPCPFPILRDMIL